jgi:hypothetical protein
VFPKNTDTHTVTTSVNTQILVELINNCKNFFSPTQLALAKKCIDVLENGSKTPFAYPFEFVRMPNASSAIKHGELMTDTIAYWLATKFVIGPFTNLPSFDFSINTLAACTAKKNKVRPIMNLSAPGHCAFNDAVNTFAVCKLSMTLPVEIGHAIVRAGRGSLIAKYDVDACKLIPAGVEEWKFFGFQWLGKYFADITTPFGSKTAPANFDCLAETIVNVVKIMAETPENCVFRQLDDISIVAPGKSKIAENFVEKLQSICNDISVPLAALCPDHNKAFTPSTYGNMLGIWFCTNSLTWKLPADKQNETLQMIKKFFNAKVISLLDFQKLHGKINAFANMCSFLKGFRLQQAKFLKKFANDNVNFLEIPVELKNEIWIWTKAIISNVQPFPIPHKLKNAGLYALTFVSDAAGMQNHDVSSNCGCASIDYDRNGKGSFIAKIDFANSNSGVLESIGLFLPFLSILHKLKNKEIILKLDNLTVVFAWSKKYAKNDEKLSLFIQTLHVIEAALPCKIYVDHVPRCSTSLAKLADALTRKSTIPTNFFQEYRHLKIHNPRSVLNNMLKKPFLNWSFPLQMADNVVNMVKVLNK